MEEGQAGKIRLEARERGDAKGLEPVCSTQGMLG
jgi:hypothetical protein